MPTSPKSAQAVKAQDEGRLAEFGYAQSLRREWSLLHNFGASFSIIIAVTAGVDFGLAKFISVTAHVCRGYNPSAGATIGIMAGVLFTHVLANMFSVRNLRYVIYGSIMLNTLGIACLCIAVIATASKRQPASFVFAKFFDGTGTDDVGWSIRASPAYVAVCGILIAQYTSVGYDASAHLCEETRKAVRDAPIAMLCAIAGSAVMGFFVLVALLFSIQDFDKVRQADLPVLQILIDSCGERGGVALMVLVLLSVWHCGLFSLVSINLLEMSFVRYSLTMAFDRCQILV
ncbi:MAG: hypothetical protein Q9214_000532 [Letrouitia sp. 1 TL-2023]